MFLVFFASSSFYLIASKATEHLLFSLSLSLAIASALA